MVFRFSTEVPLRWVDIDSWGVLNNAVYLSLMEQARYEYFGKLGLLEAGQVGFVLAEATVRFLRPGRMGMRPSVSARTSRLGNSSFEMEYEVRAGAELLATGKAALVYVDAALKARPIPAAARRAIAAFEGIAAAPPG